MRAEHGRKISHLVKIRETLADDLHRAQEVVLEITSGGAKRTLKKGIRMSDEESGGGAHVDVGRFREDATALKEEAELPRGTPADALRLIDHDGVQQPAPAHGLHERRAQRAHGVAEDLTELRRARGELLIDENAQRGEGDGAAEGVARGQVSAVLRVNE